MTDPAFPPVSKPLLVYDGDCNFCRRWVARWKSLTGDWIDYEPFQQAAPRLPGIKIEQFAASVQLVEPDGRITSAAEAVFRTLSHAPYRGWMLRAYQKLPGFAPASEGFYRLVARHRVFFSRLTSWLWGQSLEPPTYQSTRWLFLRFLGLIYLFAFASLWIQVGGLIGHNGILPAEGLLRAAREQLGAQAYRFLPTLCWLSASDGFLRFLCGGGTLLSLLLIAGLAPGPILLILWAFYLSLTTVGRDFMSFQWDILLIETGFLAVFFAPWRLWPKSSRGSPPSSMALWLLRWLLFRLIFESGCVKLLSGDPNWRNLTALYYHYETQPLPTWIGWYAHHLPAWFQSMSVAIMFATELGAPFLIFLPRRPRLLGFLAIASLQVLIALTGNYCFFNLITLALCLLLLDDALLGRLWPPLSFRLTLPTPRKAPRLRPFLVGALAAVVFLMSGVQLFGMFSGRLSLPHPIAAAYHGLRPLMIVNNYGLFAVMTTSRPEIVIEGSSDGRTWLEYEFKWKPGNLKRRPGFVEPHQPRLDWQMWFAALSSYQDNPWFLGFMRRLLEGSPEVLTLLAKNPFPAAPPRYLRALVYQYHFTGFAQRRAGAWWRRELKGLYCPVLSLR